MPLSLTVCKKCYEINGITLDQYKWDKQGKVWCIYKAKKIQECYSIWIMTKTLFDDTMRDEYTSRYRNPPDCCPYDVEHAVNLKST